MEELILENWRFAIRDPSLAVEVFIRTDANTVHEKLG
jgi:hypothetical protein